MFCRFYSTLLLSCIGAAVASATSVVETPLESQVRDAAFIVTGRVVDVKMKGRFGLSVSDPAAKTGPGSPYSLWLIVEFDQSTVLKGDVARLPSKKVLPLWKSWIKSLASEREASLGRSFIFFLDSAFSSASEHFQHFDFERPAIESAVALEKNEPIQPAQPARGKAPRG
ncbi:MAG: hypothetical protein HYV95_10700 [Opitutae bacterium]|nr:hypothetical protein [Opitutae bacterium]